MLRGLRFPKCPKNDYIARIKKDSITIMKAGDVCKRSGLYCCGYHQKNKIRVFENSAFPRCDYKELKCEAFWCFVKTIKIKTQQEVYEANNRKRYRPRRSRREMTEEELKEQLKKQLDHWK